MASPKSKKPAKISQGTKAAKRVRVYRGSVITNTLYDGPHGKYMAAVLDREILRDEKTGKPFVYQQTGTVVWA